MHVLTGALCVIMMNALQDFKLCQDVFKELTRSFLSSSHSPTPCTKKNERVRTYFYIIYCIAKSPFNSLTACRDRFMGLTCFLTWSALNVLQRIMNAEKSSRCSVSWQSWDIHISKSKKTELTSLVCLKHCESHRKEAPAGKLLNFSPDL